MIRFLGFATGIALILWGLATLYGEGEPVTGYMQHDAQRHLRLDSHPCGPVREGRAIGVLRIPRIGVEQVVVQGTSHDDLTQGPGHYPGTGFPGSGRVIAIAGHRTTWGAPFRHLDSLHKGNLIVFCGVRYHVRRIVIVPEDDWGIIHKHRPVETLILSACHPLYSASHRIIVVAYR